MKFCFLLAAGIFLNLICLSGCSLCSSTVVSQNDIPWTNEVGVQLLPDTIAEVLAPFDFPQPERPVFPELTVSIVDYGAIEEPMATQAINRAIEDVHHRGGGTVLVPSGCWKTGRIELLSGVNLHLQAGSELHFSGAVADYQPAVFTRHEGVELYSLGALVYADGQENIALTGQGKLIGPPRDCEIQQRQMRGGVIENLIDAESPVESRYYDGRDGGSIFLPMFVSPIRCRRVFIEGITLENTPFWNIVPVYCDSVIIRGVTVFSEGIPRGDGIDIESSRNVLIEYCTLSCGDDCFTLKAGRCADGLRVNKPTENVVIRYCLARNGHGAITCGSETAGMIRRLYVHDCVFEGTDTGLRFKTRRNRGGGGEQLYYERLRMKLRKEPFVWDMLGSKMFVGDLAVRLPARDLTPLTPSYAHIEVRDVVVECCRRLVDVVGIPESPVSQVTFERVSARCHRLMRLQDVEGMTFRDMSICSADSLISLTDARGVLFERVSFEIPGGAVQTLTEGTHVEFPHYNACTYTIPAITDGSETQ